MALRVGAAFDRLLVYGKGGVAWGGFDFKESEVGPGASTDALVGSRTLPGLLIGVGNGICVPCKLERKNRV